MNVISPPVPDSTPDPVPSFLLVEGCSAGSGRCLDLAQRFAEPRATVAAEEFFRFLVAEASLGAPDLPRP